VSDDGAYAIVVIALLGNPFSPAYARARAAGETVAPSSFSALNVAIYGRGARVWSLRERVANCVHGAAELRLGPNSMSWEKDALVVRIDERTTPFGRPIRGIVRLTPQATPGLALPLDAAGRHTWWPVAPLSRIDVALSEPALRFEGQGYHDANAGDAPLDDDFRGWSWARARAGNRALVTYDVVERQGSRRTLAFAIDHGVTTLDVAPLRLPRGHWGVERHIAADRGATAEILRSLEDGPFYTRALVRTHLGGSPVIALQETLSAERLRRAWVRFLTGFRMGKAS
jgi:carotenoid 1,2-hydratase